MNLTAELVAVVISMVLAGVAGFLRLEGRVNVLDRVLEDQIEAKQKALDETHRVLGRLEIKIDRIAMNCVAYHHAVPPKLVPNLMPEDVESDEDR